MVHGRLTVPDYSPAFVRAQASYLKGLTGNANVDKRRFYTQAERILFGTTTREYHFSATLDVFGAYLLSERGGVILYVHTTGPAVRVHMPKSVGTPATAPDYLDMPGGTHPSGYGGKSWISNLQIDGMSTASHGVLASVRCDLMEVMVDNINGPGIVISADVKRPEKSNANDCRLTGCVAQSCKGDGFSWFGGDASSGYTINCRAQSCDGWGFNDSSFFGNTHVAPRSVLCGTGPRSRNGTPEVQLAFRTNSANQGTVFLNPYVEGYEATIDVLPYSMVLGGTGGKLSANTTLVRGRQEQGQFEFAGTGGKVRFGVADCIFDIETVTAAGGAGKSIAFQRDVSGRVDVEHGRINAYRYMTFLTEESASGTDKRAAGKLAFDQGFYEGQCVRLAPTASLTPPALSTIPHAGPGSTWHTSVPQRGQPFEWTIVKKPDATLEWVVVSTLPI